MLPCPFCGGEAEVEEIGEPGGSVRFSVGCTDTHEADCMGFQSHTTFARRGYAIAAWNRRAPHNDELLAAAKLQEAAESFHLSCDDCEGNEIPELCEACFPHYDAARVARRVALAKIDPTLYPQERG